jgi:metallo-beta-lactamase family protein
VRIHGELIQNKAQIHTLGGLSAHGDQADLLRWYDSFTPHPPVYIVHGEVPSGEALAIELRAHGAVATVTRPGLKIDLASLPVLARDSSAP